jgi:hypothetical protein
MITSSILRMNKPEWVLIVIGCLAAFLNGVEQPVYCFVQTKLTIVYNTEIFSFQRLIFFR